MKKSSFLVGGALLLSALFTTSCDEIMSNLDQPVSSYLTVNAADVTIPLDEGTYQIEASSINSDKPITYKSSNPEVATVDAKGIVTPLTDGETEITVAVEASENYNAGEQKVKIAVKQPLTFEAKKDGVIQVQFAGFVPEKPIVYTINKGAKQEINSYTEIDVKKGDKVQFESANETLTAGDGSWGVQIVPQQSCAVYGNVMSMISPDGNYHINKTISKDYALKGLLCGTGNWEYNPTTDTWECKELYTVSHDKYKLTLPATTLTKGCYSWMLAYTGLTEVPELPATKIPDNAYQLMFYNCYELTEAPAINVETVGEYGCSEMFNNCKKLAKANAIHVKDVGPSALRWMFNVCGELTEAPAITAETVDEYGLASMFYGCEKLTKANDINIKDAVGDHCLAWMFINCISLTESPAISVKSLGDNGCYAMFFNNQKMTKAKPIYAEKTIGNYGFNWMFEQCVELTESPAITAETIGEYACQNMFSGCQKLKKANAIKVKTAGNYAFQNLFANQPELTEVVAVNAETMGERACSSMFYNCPKLTKVPATLPAINLANYCYEWMFASCTKLENVLALPATELKEGCYLGMFYLCSSLQKAPDLKAETLADRCYESMFEECTKLSYVKCLAKSCSNYCSVTWMLYNAGTDESVTTRTLERDPDTYWYITASNYSNVLYVPIGWTITPPYEAISAPKATPSQVKEVPVLNRSARHQVEMPVSNKTSMKPEMPAMFKK